MLFDRGDTVIRPRRKRLPISWHRRHEQAARQVNFLVAGQAFAEILSLLELQEF